MHQIGSLCLYTKAKSGGHLVPLKDKAPPGVETGRALVGGKTAPPDGGERPGPGSLIELPRSPAREARGPTCLGKGIGRSRDSDMQSLM